MIPDGSEGDDEDEEDEEAERVFRAIYLECFEMLREASLTPSYGQIQATYGDLLRIGLDSLVRPADDDDEEDSSDEEAKAEAEFWGSWGRRSSVPATRWESVD